MEEFSPLRARDFAGRMTDYIGRDRPRYRDYEEAFDLLDVSSEGVDRIISALTQDQKIKAAVDTSKDINQARGRVISMLGDRMKAVKADLKIRSIILDSLELQRVIADQVVYSVDKEAEEELITEYNDSVERVSEREFTMKEILDQICSAEHLRISDLELTNIEKDKNEKVLRWIFRFIPKKGVKNPKNITILFSFDYPFKSSGSKGGSGAPSPEYPTITRLIDFSSRPVLIFKNDIWQKVWDEDSFENEKEPWQS